MHQLLRSFRLHLIDVKLLPDDEDDGVIADQRFNRQAVFDAFGQAYCWP